MTESFIRLAMLGVIITNNGDGQEVIQKIDNPEEFSEEHGIEYIPTLETDQDAVEVVTELVIDNYIEKIHQDLQEGNKELLYALLSGQGIKPISELTEQELITEAKELEII
jgi:hypothetical protein